MLSYFESDHHWVVLPLCLTAADLHSDPTNKFQVTEVLSTSCTLISNIFVGRIVAPTVTLQGNLDPACLYGSHVSNKLNYYTFYSLSDFSLAKTLHLPVIWKSAQPASILVINL